VINARVIKETGLLCIEVNGNSIELTKEQVICLIGILEQYEDTDIAKEEDFL